MAAPAKPRPGLGIGPVASGAVAVLSRRYGGSARRRYRGDTALAGRRRIHGEKPESDSGNGPCGRVFPDLPRGVQPSRVEFRPVVPCAGRGAASSLAYRPGSEPSGHVC